MLKNYSKIALRNLWKANGYPAINIFGLAVGLAACLLILIYVMDEASYDKFNKAADRIYRVNADVKFGGELQKLAVAPDPMAFTMIQDHPQVENAVRFRKYGSSPVKKVTPNFKEGRIIFTDSTLCDVFTLLMIAGNLGLLGLVTYTAEQRTKEIDIRKVLGISVSNIVNRLSKDFLKLVGIALLLAFPLAWRAMNKWLEDFAYRITIDWNVFGIAALVTISIAIVTASFQTIKAALVNPVKNLRTE